MLFSRIDVKHNMHNALQLYKITKLINSKTNEKQRRKKTSLILNKLDKENNFSVHVNIKILCTSYSTHHIATSHECNNQKFERNINQ